PGTITISTDTHNVSLYSYGEHPDLHSFPTRRSSDLTGALTNMGTTSVDRSLTLNNGGDGLTNRSTLTVADNALLTLSSGSQTFEDRKSTRLNSSHRTSSYADICFNKNKARTISSPSG